MSGQSQVETPLRIDVRNVRVNQALSQETSCFSATLYVDGRRVGTAGNRGEGGCNEYDVARDILEKMEKSAREWCAGNVDWWKPEYLEALDAMIGELIDRKEEEKFVRRRAGSQTLFRLKGDAKGVWRAVSGPRGPQVEAWIRERYGDQIERIV